FGCRKKTALALKNGNKNWWQPEPVHPETVFVIFRKTRRLKDAIGVRGRQYFESFALESGTHSARRNKAAQRLPRTQVLHLEFSKFIAVNSVGQLSPGRP